MIEPINVCDDEAGSQVERLLEGGGIHSYLQRDAAISTIIKLRVIGRQQQMLRIDFEDAPSDTVLRDTLKQFNALLPHYDVVVLSEWLKTDDGACCKLLGTLPIDPVINGEGAGIAVRKGDALADKFTAAIAAIRANGKYQEINAKYFPFDVYGE